MSFKLLPLASSMTGAIRGLLRERPSLSPLLSSFREARVHLQATLCTHPSDHLQVVIQLNYLQLSSGSFDFHLSLSFLGINILHCTPPPAPQDTRKHPGNRPGVVVHSPGYALNQLVGLKKYRHLGFIPRDFNYSGHQNF